MIAHALSHTAVTFVAGLVLAAVVYALARVGGRAYENSLRVERERPERFDVIDLSGEIDVIGGSRPSASERWAGPESRVDRLPFSGRRSVR